MKKISLRATALAVAALAAGQAWATNGMLMEGYGPIALSMGGASQAYDNGTAAMMNNVATLQLGENGTRADVALGVLGPNVTAMGDKSGGTSYVMPAVGWTKKNDRFSFGVGLMGQGGMGTEYSSTSPLAMGTGENVRSELSVGRVIFPFTFAVNDELTLGASLDYSWAGLDVKMAASAGSATGQLENMYASANGITPTAASNLFNGTGAMVDQMSAGTALTGARLDFSNSNDFTGSASSGGWTGKLGLVYKPTSDLNIGLSYQPKTNLADMKTSATGATFTMIINNNVGAMPIPGQITVHDFQMPSVTALGASFQATPKLMIAADIKSIGWASVMEKFNMTFTSSMLQSPMKFAMDQHWKNQTVFSVGGAYAVNDQLVARAGYSHSTNPVPDAYVHPLFPAIVKNHFTTGFSYRASKNLEWNGAISHAPKVSVVNSNDGTPITHSQTNYQLMLSYRY